jgi:hypothetical protein
MKRAVCFVVCVILAVAGAAGSIYLHGERKISGSQVASGRPAASEIEVWGTISISTKAKAPANSAPFAIVASGDLPAALPDDIATYDSTIAPVLNISDLQIPLIVFQKTPDANPGAFNPIRGFRGFWSPVQGALAINNESSLAASSATEGAFYDLLRTTYWDGSDRIDFFNPSTPASGWQLGAEDYFRLAHSRLDMSGDSLPSILYCAPWSAQYLASAMQNRLDLLAGNGGKTAEETFSFKTPSTGAQSYLYPLLLAHTGPDPLILAAGKSADGRNRDYLYLIRVDKEAITYTKVKDSFDSYLSGQPSNCAISFIADAATSAAVCGRSIYVGDICGEATWSFEMNNDTPVLSYETGINKYILPWIQAHPAEGEIRPTYYTYQGVLIVAAVGNKAQGFWAFQDGRLLGAMQILNDGEVDVFTVSQPGKAAFMRKIPGLVTVLLPRDDSNTWR